MLSYLVIRVQAALLRSGAASAFLARRPPPAGSAVMLHDEHGPLMRATIAKSEAAAPEALRAACVTAIEKSATYPDHGYVCTLADAAPVPDGLPYAETICKRDVALVREVDGRLDDATDEALALSATAAAVAGAEGPLPARALASGIKKSLAPLGEPPEPGPWAAACKGAEGIVPEAAELLALLTPPAPVRKRAAAPEIDFTALGEMKDADLEAALKARAALVPEAKGSEREGLLNEVLALDAELSRRGVKHELPAEVADEIGQLRKLIKRDTAPVYPSGEKMDGPPVALEIVLSHVKPIVLRDAAVVLTGGVVNNGASGNDIDVLVKGPLDEATRKAIEFRLGRMFPPEISKRVQFLTDDLGGPVTDHIALYDLALVPRGEFVVKEMRDGSTEKSADPLLDYPAENGPHDAVLQAHARGATLHFDLRMKINDHLVGFTLAAQTPAVPEVKDLATAKRIAAALDVPGGGRYNKPLLAPARLWATPKAAQPLDWLKIDAQEFEADTVGATENLEGFIVAIDRPRVEWGAQKPAFHEFFFTGGKQLAGILTFRLLEGGPRKAAEGGTPEGEMFWAAQLSKDALPYVLGKRAVDEGWMPPDGVAAIPEALMKATPPEMRYWEATGAEARKRRDALVEARLFTERTVTVEGGEFVVTGTKKTADLTAGLAEVNKALAEFERATKATAGHFRLLYQMDRAADAGGPGPSHERWLLALWAGDGAEGQLWSAENDPTENDSVALAALPWCSDVIGDAVVGEIPEGKAFAGGLVPNPAGRAWITEEDAGETTITEEAAGVLALEFAGKKMKGGAELRQEGDGDDRTLSCARSGEVKKCLTADGVQYWQPEGVTGGDVLRPPAYFAPQVPAECADFAKLCTPENLREGVFIEPRFEGASVVLQHVAKGDKVLAFTEEAWEDCSEKWPAVAADVRKVADGRDLVVVGKSMPGEGEAAPRMMLDDMIHDGENLTQKWQDERRAVMEKRFEGQEVKGLALAPSRLVHAAAEFEDAVKWAAAVPGSTGATAKMRASTYSLSGESEGWASAKVAAPPVPDPLPDEPGPTVKRWIVKADESPNECYVLGVVLEPLDRKEGETDAQGDDYKKKEIRKAMRFWMEKYGVIGLMHKGKIAPEKAKVIECFIYDPEAWGIKNEKPLDNQVGAGMLKEGSWLLGAILYDPELIRKARNGELTGWSIGGTARVNPAA